MEATLQAALAPSSIKNLQVQQSIYRQFCNYFNLQMVPATRRTLCLFAQFLARKFKAPSTIRNYLNGVRILHALQCEDTEQFYHPTLLLLQKGLARNMQHCPRQALPISPAMLVAMRGMLDLHDPVDASYWSLIILSFFIFSRKSNMVPQPIAKFDPKKQLTRQDVIVKRNMLLVTIKWSKTIQFGQRQHIVPVLAIPGCPLCPVMAYKNMLRLVPAQSNVAAFLVTKGDKTQPITYRQFSAKLKSLLTATGHTAAAYSTHSLRRGGASYMSSAGVSKEMIKLVGDWRSDAVDQYIQVDLPTKVKAAQLMRAQILQDI